MWYTVEKRPFCGTRSGKEVPAWAPMTAIANALQVRPDKRTASFERFKTELSAAPTLVNEVDQTEAIRRIPPLDLKMPQSRGRVHTNVVELSPGRLVAFLRSREADWIYRSLSCDDGETWTVPQPMPLPNNNSSISAIKLQSGRIAIAYNPTQRPGAEPGVAVWPGLRCPVAVALSEDGGESFPLIRYRTHDLSRIIPSNSPCPCGRTYPRIDVILGRTDDMIKVKGVNIFPAQFDSVLKKIKDVSSEYQIMIDHLEGKDAVTLFFETPVAEHSILKRIEADVKIQCKSDIGISVNPKGVAIGELPRSEKKTTRIFDNRY